MVGHKSKKFSETEEDKNNVVRCSEIGTIFFKTRATIIFSVVSYIDPL